MAKNKLTRDDDFLDPEAQNGVGKAIRNSKVFKDLSKKIRESLKKVLKQVLEALGKALSHPVVLIVVAIIIVILLFVSLVQAFLNLPGDMQARLKAFFDKKFEGWHWNNGASDKLAEDYSDIIDVVNYLEEMEYDVINYGFVKPELNDSKKIYTMDELVTNGYAYNTYQYMQEQGFTYGATDNLYHLFNMNTGAIYDGTYYNGVGIEIDNYSNEKVTNTVKVDGQDKEAYTDNFGMIRSTEEYNENGKGKLIKIKNSEQAKNMYGLIRTYLLSDYRIYSLRNYDEKVLNKFVDGFKIVFGGNQDAWCKGLIKLYQAKNGIASSMWNFSDRLKGDSAHVTRETLELKDGYFNNAMSYKIEGWAPRYGLSLEFLLSIHLGTMAPDLVYAILQNFDTEVQVYLNDSGDAKVNARFVDVNQLCEPSSEEALSVQRVEEVLSANGHKVAAWGVNDAALTQWVNGAFLNKKACQTLLTSDEISISSPYNCTAEPTTNVIEISTYETNNVLWWDTSTNPLDWYGITESSGKDDQLYGITTNYPNTTFPGNTSQNTFDAKHVIQTMGTDEGWLEDNIELAAHLDKAHELRI